MVWLPALPDGQKNFEDTITHFDRIHACDGRIDRHTCDDIGRACIAKLHALMS